MRLQRAMVLERVNPRPPGGLRRGTVSWSLTQLYRQGMTVGEYLDAVTASGAATQRRAESHLRFDVRHGHVVLSLWGVEIAATVAPRSGGRAARPAAEPYVPSALSAILSRFTFGTEFEFLIPRGAARSSVVERLTSAGLPCQDERYNHALRPHWKLTTDGSLGDYNRGCEVVSPVLSGDDGLRAVATVAHELRAMRCRITRSCGFHVHVGLGDRGPTWLRRVYATYAAHEHLIDGVVPESRRSNHFCKTIRHYVRRVEQQQTIADMTAAARDRFCKVNLQAVVRHGTVEFRQHSGTVEADKACSWVKLMLRICAYAEASDGPVQMCGTLTEFLRMLGCEDDEVAFWEARAARFAAPAPTSRDPWRDAVYFTGGAPAPSETGSPAEPWHNPELA